MTDRRSHQEAWSLYNTLVSVNCGACWPHTGQCQLWCLLAPGSHLAVLVLQYDVAILDPALSLTESECIVRAKNYTLTEANMEGTAPANVWNYCSTGICNYTLLNGTSGTFVSPYAGTHTESICQMGYSNAVDNNEYVEPAYITGIGQGTAGKLP